MPPIDFIEVIDVVRRNVWDAMREMLSVEPRTSALVSLTDSSDRTLYYRDSAYTGNARETLRF